MPADPPLTEPTLLPIRLDGLVETICAQCGREALCACCDAETPDGFEVWFECEDCLDQYNFD